MARCPKPRGLDEQGRDDERSEAIDSDDQEPVGLRAVRRSCPELATATERAPGALHVSDIGFRFRRKGTGVGSDRGRPCVVGSKS